MPSFPLILTAALLGLVGACSPTIVEAEKAVAPDAIVGSWIVEDIDNRGVVDSARLEVNFDAQGFVSGLAACNNFTGEYDYDDGAVSIGPLAATEKACAPALMDMETKMLERLQSVTTAAIDRTGALILSDGDGRLLLRKAE